MRLEDIEKDKDDLKSIDGLIDSLLTENHQFKKDLNSHVLPPFYGLRKVFNPKFNGTYSAYLKMERGRKELATKLVERGADFEPYEKYTIYLHSYWKNPGDSLNRDTKIRVFLFGLAQFEGRYYHHWLNRYLFKANKELDKLKKDYKVVEKYCEKNEKREVIGSD